MKIANLPYSIVLGLLACSPQLGAQTANAPVPAVIVIRHGEDLKGTWPTDKADKDVKTWIQNWAPGWPKYTLPNGTSVTVHQHGLSPLGEKQAAWLATNLPALLKDKDVNFMPITRVVTKDPFTPDGSSWPTPNPFDTAWPFIKANNIRDVVLVAPKKGVNPYGPRANQINETVDKELLDMLPCYNGSTKNEKPSDSILPTDASGEVTGSTLIVWDGQGMWGPHIGEDWYWADDTDHEDQDRKDKVVGANILRLLGGTVIGDGIFNKSSSKGGGIAGKARRVYLFYPRFGAGAFWKSKSSEANNAHIARHGENVPEYDLMVWDISTNDNGPTGWKNVVNFSVDEEQGIEHVSYPPLELPPQ